MRVRVKGKLSDESGMTLIEMLISVMLLFILLLGVLYIFEYGLLNAKQMQARSILNVDAANTLEKIERQIRCAKSFVVPATNSPIDFIADVRGDVIKEDREIIFYRDANANTLNVSERIGAGATTTYEIAKGVTALAFAYYDADGAALTVDSTNRTQIKRVEVSFTMQKSAGSKTVVTTKTGTVQIRCELAMIVENRRVRA